MKNSTIFLVLFATLIFCSSCGVKNYIAPPFTDVEKILKLETGLTIDQVSEVLKIKPYDMVHSYESGSVVLIYNYRVIDRKMALPARAADRIVHSKDAQKEGEEWYNIDHKELYLLFNDGKLKSAFGERTFSEGSYLEMVEKNLIAPRMNGTATNQISENDYVLLQNVYQERNALRQAEVLQVDEQIEKRRKWLKNAAIVTVVILGIIGLR